MEHELMATRPYSGSAIYGLVGAGGFGREVMPIARDYLAAAHETAAEIVFVVENLAEPYEINGYRVISDHDFFADKRDKRFNIAIADSRVRERVARKFLAAGARAFEIAALNSVRLDGNVIGDGAILCPFTTITSNTRIGAFFHSNIYSYVAHDCVLGDFVTFAPNVRCNGRVVIENHAYIGTGAVIREGTDARPIVIGEGATVGMGAVVTKSVRPHTTVVGNPARELERQ